MTAIDQAALAAPPPVEEISDTRAQVRAILLEPFGQPVVFAHRSRSSVAVCHIDDPRNRVDVTATIWSTHE